MNRKIAELYENIQNFNYQKPAMEHGEKQLMRRVEDAKDNISGAINGIINYYNGLLYQIKQNKNDVGLVEELEQLDQFTRKQLNQFRNYTAPEDSTYYQG